VNRRQWFDQIASKWDTVFTEEIVARLREIIAGLDIKPGASVLDLGCGTGVLFPILLDKVGREGCITGLDICGEMLKRAQAKGYAIECVQGDAQNLPLRDQAFDWVICNAAFPHFLDKPFALREIRRVLKDGGQLVICHPKSRETVNATHRSIGDPVANDIIPPEEEMCCLLSAAALDHTMVCDESDHYVVLACRPPNGADAREQGDTRRQDVA